MGLSHQVYWKLRPWVTPGLQNSHMTYGRRLQLLAGKVSSWLDVGCGHGFVPDWVPFQPDCHNGARKVVGVDRDLHALRAHGGLRWGLMADGEAIPFIDGSFDLVTTNMVLEHVRAPERLFAEVFRVLRPGGVFFSHTPNLSGYTTALTRLGPPAVRVRLAKLLQGREAEDVYPTYYRANTAAALGTLATNAGFTRCSIELIDSSPLFANFLPLLLPEMVFIRLTRVLAVEKLRPCFLATLHKPIS